MKKKLIISLSFVILIISVIFGYSVYIKKTTPVEKILTTETVKLTTPATTTNNFRADTDKPKAEIKPSVPQGTKAVDLRFQLKIPVLMYHFVRTDPSKVDTIVQTKDFEAQMNYLKTNGFSTLSMDDLYSALTTGKNIPKKPVVITIDDGYTDTFTDAYPIIKKYGFKAVVFMISNRLDVDPRYMKSENIKELEANGISIEDHTANHEKLATLTYDASVATLNKSKATLEPLLNKKLLYFAYPFGSLNETSIKAVKDTGFKMAFSTKSGYANLGNGILTVNRFQISQNMTFEKFKTIVNAN